MRLLWFIFTLHTAFAQVGFGRSYLRNSRLCHEWNCVNTKLGLPDSLPPREQYTAVIKGLLPAGAWQDAVDLALDVCYGARSRRYTNTCPGQALMHCLVDQLIEHCPEESLRKNDGCSPVSSLAGLKYMFSQSLYENLEANLAVEHRPAWFLRNYFKSKCCRIPPFIDSTLLSQCHFGSFMQYYSHSPKYESVVVYPRVSAAVPVQTTLSNVDKLNVTNAEQMTTSIPVQTTPSSGDKVHVVSLKDTTEPPKDLTDPINCCNMDEYIKPTWRSECQFELTWDDQARLSVVDKPIVTTAAPPTTTRKPSRERDIIILPQSCEQETCVFKKLNIVSDTGAVDMDAFLKLLDNFTSSNPSWMKAKARVVTACLVRTIREYDAECDINKVLACTFDVLTENCPQTKKIDLCKHSKENRVCQISSSKFRPKHRRDTCYLPELVSREVLTECGINSLTQVKQAAEMPVVTNKNGFSTYFTKRSCKDQSQSTTCLMNKMGILNKYGFMDHFKMKDYIRRYTNGHQELMPWGSVYLSAFTNIPMYREHCSSPKKLLNVIDSMIMTCPISRRKATPQCAKIFSEMTQAPPISQNNETKEKTDRILNHFHQVFWPVSVNTPPKQQYKISKKPIYNYGILSSKNAPNVEIINVKPTVRKPLVLIPVYMRFPAQNQLVRPFPNDGVWRNNPFWLHNQIAQAHLNSTTTASPNPTIPTKSTKSYNPTMSAGNYQPILP